LIALNCGAIPSSLIQAELFGHEKSAFTGAAQRRAGSFEAADRGSVFLDEIGELPLEMQPALLRVLQERSVTRLGSSRPVPVDFRLIAATHVDLPEAVAAGRFREDLLFRINVLTVQVPPLRDREDDVILLAERFREEFAGGSKGAGPRGFTQDAVRHIRQHRWPGNVRELINRVQRAVLMADGRLISAADLGFEGAPLAPNGATLAQARSQFERGLIRDALRESGHCMAGAARRLGVSRVTLYRMIDRLGLDDSSADARGEARMLASRHAGSVSELKSGRFIP
jgi:transcriptional regulator with GAF, ATPase, and Fis domain